MIRTVRMKRGGAIFLVMCAAGLVTPRVASANTPEDIQGLGGRMNGMGGAGTAAATDFSATYYNPANLSRCRSSQVSLAIRHSSYGIDIDDQSGPVPGDPDGDPTTDADYPTPKDLRNQTRISIGFCNHLPFGLSFGMSFGVGLQNPMTLDQSTLNQRPHFLLYGEQLEQLSIVLGIAYRPIPQLSFGIGASILVHSDLSINTDIVVAGGAGETSEVIFQWNLKPVAALYAGVHVAPIEQLHIGLTYRGALFHDLNTPVNVDASALGLGIPIQLFVESAAWYSPQQLAFGVSGDPVSWLTLAWDMTWYNYAAHPGPLMVAQPDNDLTAAAVGFPRREGYDFRNVVAIRMGGEARFLDDALAVRFGYGYRPSAAPLAGSSADCRAQTERTGMPPAGTGFIPCRANVLDSNVHSISFGAGYTFGGTVDTEVDPVHDTPEYGDDELEAEDDDAGDADAEEAPAPAGQPAWARGAAEPEPEPRRGRGGRGGRGAAPAPTEPETAQRDASLTGVAHAGVGGTPRVSTDDEGERTYDPHRSVGATATVDAYVRINKMTRRTVNRDPRDYDLTRPDVSTLPISYWTDYSFGGRIIDVGVTLTVGWY